MDSSFKADINGGLLVDKPGGWTSHDVVDFFRRRLGVKKAGHAGTLDPAATGLLVILLGRATKLSADFLNDDKTYEAGLTLGARTDTGDAEGRVLEMRGTGDIDEESVRAVMGEFRGEITQTPPMYSAKKVKGKSLYKLARRGIEVDRKPRVVFIRELDIDGISMPHVDFMVVCSKGTYVRQLCADIGERLGCGAYMSRLPRTVSGRLCLGGAMRPEEIAEAAQRAAGGLAGLGPFVPMEALKELSQRA